jgi:16S rRNA (cytidine1402-2'-O)-methyltransferase
VPSAAGEPGTLWIVATPIGTLGDFAPRALEVLRGVDLILAEDTRRARALLGHFGVAAAGRLRSLHEHNEEHKVAALLAELAAGRSLALVSDAGTPVLSDPGFLLVRAAREAGLPVSSLPGPSSFTAALAASGQPPLPAVLSGFLPARPGPRRRRVAELARVPWTLVVLLSPHRLGRELADLAEVLGAGRRATLLAEISKHHERATVGTLRELAGGTEAESPRGEYVLVVGPADEAPGEAAGPGREEVLEAYREALGDGLERPDALRRTARRLGLPRREVFAILAAEDDGGCGRS